MDVALILTTAVFVENKGTCAHRNSTHHSSDDATWCVARIESNGNNAAGMAAKDFKSNLMSSHVFFVISSRLPLIHTLQGKSVLHRVESIQWDIVSLRCIRSTKLGSVREF